MIFNTADYKTREEFDRAIAAVSGIDTTVKLKTTHKINGTAKDLKRLQLSADTTIFGVQVEINEEK